MAGQEPAAQAPDRNDRQVRGLGRQAFDKSQSAPRSGSVGLVLLVALALIVAAGGLLYVEPHSGGTYILVLLATLGTIGVAGFIRHGLRYPAIFRPRARQSAAQGGGRQRLRRHCGHRPIGSRVLRQRHLSRPDRGGRQQRRAADRARLRRRSRGLRNRSTACSRPRARAAACRRKCAFPAPRRRPRAGCACACARSARAGTRA